MLLWLIKNFWRLFVYDSLYTTVFKQLYSSENTKLNCSIATVGVHLMHVQICSFLILNLPCSSSGLLVKADVCRNGLKAVNISTRLISVCCYGIAAIISLACWTFVKWLAFRIPSPWYTYICRQLFLPNL